MEEKRSMANKRAILLLLAFAIIAAFLCGCGKADNEVVIENETVSLPDRVQRVPNSVWSIILKTHILETDEEIDWSFLEPATDMARGYNIDVLCRKINNQYYLYYISHFDNGKAIIDEMWISTSSWDNSIIYLSRDEFPDVLAIL